MTQNFYLKTQSLHEEFQRREMHYLNLERKFNMMLKKDHNVPLQEYRQKINEKEKETEETYRNIIKQMDRLGQHTDALTLKLEKLGIFQTSIQSTAASNQPFNVQYHIQNQDVSHNVNMKSSIQQIQSNSTYASRSMSTQTESVIYCNNCQSLILNQSQSSHTEDMANSCMNTSLLQSDKLQFAQASSSLNKFGSSLNEHLNKSQIAQTSINDAPIMLEVNQNKNSNENYKTECVEGGKFSVGIIQSGILLDEKHTLVGSNEILITENPQNIPGDKNINGSQTLANENNQSKSIDSETYVDVCCVSKSDAESMNEEFNFLESEPVNTSTPSKPQNDLKTFVTPSKDVNINIKNAANSSGIHPNQNIVKHKKANDLQPSTEVEIGDDKSDSSSSVTGPHSSNISVASDSDKIYEKELPLTASAAYKALLRNSVTSMESKKNDSEYESEDEVENTLANTVQRTNVELKPTSMNKSQSKIQLSKNTRKVLGLDSSSSSEVEMAVNCPEKKVEEDSDEFEFYD